MRLNTTLIALAATTLLCGALPAAAQTTMTIQAEGMARTYYALDGSLIKAISYSSPATATQTFSGPSGTYNIQVFVQLENDGQPTLELYRGSTLLRRYVYPLGTALTSFTVSNVALTTGQQLRLVGRIQGGAHARVDKMVLTQVAAATTSSTTTSSTTSSTTTSSTTTATTSGSAVTMEAEGMTLSSYAVENGNRIKLTSSSGSASKSFSGASGTYKMQVYVQPETDGQSTLEVYRGTTRLRAYTYPLSNTATSFTIDNVALNSGQTIKLVGRANGGAWARVDKIAFTPVATTTPTTSTSTPPTGSTSATATTACANPSNGYEGFGRNTTGGAGKPVYRVTNLNDSGAGSLRDAVSQGNRCVVFDVGGTISLAGTLLVRGANVTIDGLTAPAPGITLRDRTLVMQGSSGAGNIVVRGIRHRYAPAGEDGIRVYNTSNIVIDRVSVSGFGDGAIDVTENSRDVTIQWSILGNGNPAHNFPSLIKYETYRVTVHHNLYINGDYRNPMAARNDPGPQATELVADVRNNLIWNYRGHGTAVMGYGTANIVNNYYYTTRSNAGNTIFVGAPGYTYGQGSAYVSGNHSQNGWNSTINAKGNRSTPFAAVEPTTTDAITAAGHVVGHAGARGPRFGLDATDQGYLGQIPIAASATLPTGGPSASSTGSTTTTASGGGVCSTAQCVLTQ